jgi:hypothetical protein
LPLKTKLFTAVAYHSPMRTLLIAFMIALLPVRGFVGDAMATTMGLQQAVAGGAAAATECPDHAGMQMPGTPAADAAGGDDSMAENACAACQMCHAAAITAQSLSVQPVFSAGVTPQQESASFSSANRAASLKPPIF